MDISLTDLKSFVAVAELCSFQDAAVALHISQPALSRRVKKLEDVLGVRLLDRTTRQIALSAIGREFLPKAQRSLDELEASLLSIQGISSRISGQVNVGCVPSAAYYFLPDVIRIFSERYTRIRVRILDGGAHVVLRSVLQGEADLGINVIGADEADLDFEPLLNEPFRLACLRDHPLAKQDVVRWSDLGGHRLITAGRSSANRLIIDHGLFNTDIRPIALYEVQHLTTALGMVEAGVGVAALPQMTLPKDQGHRVISRPLIEPEIRRTVGIIRRRGTTLSPAALEFYRILKETWERSDRDRLVATT